MNPKKVIIFDSGVGGLSIQREISKRLSFLECHYLSDSLFFPYGELDPATVIERVCLLIPTLAQQINADAVVIACNTASTVALESLRDVLKIPVVGVVPAMKPAAQLSKSKHIALIATPATVNRPYTHQLIQTYAMQCSVTLIGSSELVRIAEQFLLGEEPSAAALAEIVKDINIQPTIDTVVLGCTHFPLIRRFLKVAIAHPVTFVDSGIAVAKQLERVLSVRPEGQCIGRRVYYSTSNDVANQRIQDVFVRLGYKKGRGF
ncbi:glutamate racemase [Echinimonas agarilytica]|uniref:Glutamate racemase n=1 Tax=Echinimonas agarilytica TaxID=1215918 RepID=A0AA42B949_9GAMM|nr:glutamate racemase [Echinimonas agarilytica]